MVMAKKNKTKKKYVWAIGRRREAVATLKLYEGKGSWLVNKIALSKYFPGKVMAITFNKPFVAGDCQGKFWGEVRVKGGGKNGQLGATVLAIARALVKYNPEVYRLLMRKAGLLTVDARTRERRKAGQMGRARKKKQSPKR